jgi:hypothetical protein
VHDALLAETRRAFTSSSDRNDNIKDPTFYFKSSPEAQFLGTIFIWPWRFSCINRNDCAYVYVRLEYTNHFGKKRRP